MKLGLFAVARKLADRKRHEEDVYAGDLWRVAGALQPEEILLDVEVDRIEAALRVAAAAMSRRHAMDATSIFDALWRREQAASTALGDGFAIPHARLPGIDRPATLFMRLRNPIPFGAADRAPVDKVLVILVPKDGADADHLQMLALVAQLFSKRGLPAQIEHATDAFSMQAVFRKAIAQVVRRAERGGP